MADVVKKHSISSELAQKRVNAAVAKARELGVAENVAILDDGGNLKAFSRMDGASMPTIEIAQNKAYTALFGISTQDFFNFSHIGRAFAAQPRAMRLHDLQRQHDVVEGRAPRQQGRILERHTDDR